MNRFEKEQALLSKYKNEITARVTGYAKKIKGMVDSAIDEEYDLVILGKAPKVKKEKKFSEFGSK